jgi:hypothetical protein
MASILHHALDVVDDAVERAVGQRHHLDPVELACALERQQLRLDLRSAPRRTSCTRGGIRLEVDDVRAAIIMP